VGEVRRWHRRLPTDREILEAIDHRHSAQYEAVSRGEDAEASDNRIYFPVDLAAVADELGVDGNLVFGRLYYYLDRKYAYQTPADGSGRAGTWVHLFWHRLDVPQGRPEVRLSDSGRWLREGGNLGPPFLASP
jgi:hypothetical protein